jgi:predicted DNA-binding WGR domain protein
VRIDALTKPTAGNPFEAIRKSFDEGKHPRWPKGSPLGGQFMMTDAQGLPLPPTIGSKANPGFQKKADAAYEAAAKGDTAKVNNILTDLQGKVDKYGGVGEGGAYATAPHSQGKWAQQAHQYVQDLADKQKGAMLAKLEAPAPGIKGENPVPDLSQYKKIEAKPGGSNPGAVYEGPDGKKYLVKGANHPSDARAHNEVLAAKLMTAAGVKAPNMHLVDLGKQYGGGLGVASEMEPISQKWTGGKAQLNAAQADFATHAWLANYDAAGTPAGDNLAFTKDGKLFNYDPGGSLLYRAQGLPKNFPGGELPATVSEWNSMRDKSINPAAHSIYGSMTADDLKASAMKLQAVDDKTIADLVAKHGPGTPEQKLKLAATLIKRRDDILSKAGLLDQPKTLGPEASKLPGGVPLPDLQGPHIGAGTGWEDNTKKAQAMYAAGDKAGLEHMATAHWQTAKNSNTAVTTENHKKLGDYAQLLANRIDDAKPALVEHPKILLHNTEPGHNKFWSAQVFTHDDGSATLEKKWGKIGSEGQTQTVPFNNTGEAWAEAQKQASAKLMHGYEQQSAPMPGAFGNTLDKPKTASLKHLSDLATAAEQAEWQLTPGEKFQKEALQAKMAIDYGVEHGDMKSLEQASAIMGKKHWLNTLESGSNADLAHTAIGAYYTAAVEHVQTYGGSNYAAANEARHEAALAHGSFGPGNAPKAEHFFAAGLDPLGDKVPFKSGDAPSHLLDIQQMTEQHALGNKAWLVSKIDTFTEAEKASYLNAAGVANVAIKKQYAQSLLDDLNGSVAADPSKPITGGVTWKAPTKDEWTKTFEATNASITGGYSKVPPAVWADYAANKLAATPGTPAWDKEYNQLLIHQSGSEATKLASAKIKEAMDAKAAALGGVASFDPTDKAHEIVTAAFKKAGHEPPPSALAFTGKISGKVLDATNAFHAGDDKAMAAAMGAIGLETNDDISRPAYQGLHKLAMTKADQFPLATGGAASIAHDAAEHPKPAAVSATTKPYVEMGDAEWKAAIERINTKVGGQHAVNLAAWTSFSKSQVTLGTKMNLEEWGKPEDASYHIAQKINQQIDLKAGASVAAAAPAPPPPTPNFQHTTKSAVEYYEGLTKKMQDAYLAGDMGALTQATMKKGGNPVWPVFESGSKIGLPKTMNGKLLSEYHDTLKGMLEANQAKQMAAALDAPVGKIPSPGENIGSNPAMPNFDRAQIPTENTNAASHNAKVYAIKVLAQKGDVKGLLALNYGTNTYGKKQVKLANDALAALGAKTADGTPLTVFAGQKKNANPALTLTGNEQSVTSTPTGKPLSAALSAKELPPHIDFANYKSPGQGLSSKAAVNAANQQVYDHLIDLAKKGDVKGLKAATFQPINAETGEKLGAPKSVSDHPSQHIKNLQVTLLQTMDEKLHPPEPLKFFEGKAFASVAAASAAVPPRPYGTTAAKHPSSQTIGYFLALGQVKDPTNLVPQKTFDLTPEAKAKAASDYSKMSSDAKHFVSAMQGSGGKQFAHPGPSLEPMMVAAHKYATELPVGTTLYKWDNLTPEMKQKLALAQPGLIIQNPAPVCTSYKPMSTQNFGSSHRFKIIVGPGGKAISSFASGSFNNEGELSLLPNFRFMVLDHKKNVEGKGWAETTVMLLPPDPDLMHKAKKLHY